MHTNSCNSFIQVLEIEGEGIWITKSTASRAAKASMSAHETTPGHKASICDLASSITSKPLNPRFGKAFLSAEDPAINTEPSQPCKRTLMLLVRVDYWQLYKHAKGGGEYIYRACNLDKAVMKMKPEQSSCNGGIFFEVRFNSGPNNGLSFRTWSRIKPCFQLALHRQSHYKNHQNNQPWSFHCSTLSLIN